MKNTDFYLRIVYLAADYFQICEYLLMLVVNDFIVHFAEMLSLDAFVFLRAFIQFKLKKVREHLFCVNSFMHDLTLYPHS